MYTVNIFINYFDQHTSTNLCNSLNAFTKKAYKSVINGKLENDDLYKAIVLNARDSLKLNHVIEQWFIIFAKNGNVRLIEIVPYQ